MMTTRPTEPLSMEEVVALFEAATFPWWIAGGWGLDLFLGGQTRPHEDIDVLTLRRDQLALQSHLTGWDLQAADPPGTGSLRPWAETEELHLPIHEVWCRQNVDGPWQLEIMLGETDDGNWLFRRNPAITRSLATFGTATRDGIPYVAPEVLLLFKAKHLRAKDEQDFEAVASKLDSSAREWLQHALSETHPGHPWFQRL